MSLFICIGISGVVASSPFLPCEFYGTIVIDDDPAPADTEIIAYIGDRAAGSVTTEHAGLYGGIGTFDIRLVVIPLAEELSDGTAVIRFAIGDRFADQTFIFESGHSTELNLTFGEHSDEVSDLIGMNIETPDDTSSET
jgi:hypothetical protein